MKSIFFDSHIPLFGKEFISLLLFTEEDLLKQKRECADLNSPFTCFEVFCSWWSNIFIMKSYKRTTLRKSCLDFSPEVELLFTGILHPLEEAFYYKRLGRVFLNIHM